MIPGAMKGGMPSEQKTEDYSISEIPVSNISPNPFQPRREFDPQGLEELKNSIIEKGIIQPITVRRKNAGYELISGERRLRACIDAGIPAIPAYIIQVDTDEDMLELALIENVQREHLNPIDLAVGYQRLIEECGLTQDEIAKKIGKDRTTITNIIRLLKLPTEIQQSVKKEEITIGHARALITLPDKPTQLAIWNLALRDGLSVRKVEALAKKANSPTGKKRKMKYDLEVLGKDNPHVNAIEEKIRKIVATKVRIKQTSKGGVIEMEYYSDEDLERLLELFEAIEI